MARKRIRIDLEDSDGAKYNFSLEGNVTREKMLKIFELMNLINIEEPETTQVRFHRSQNMAYYRQEFPNRQVHIIYDLGKI